MTDLIGQSLGRYHILEQLGEGGMATVYKGYDTRLECEVAIKFIRMERLAPEATGKALKRFEREAKALARLSHPNIVKVTDYGEHEGRPYLVMPYLHGGTLKQRLQEKPVEWREAARLLVPIAEALAYAHEQGILHRDIKPSNILITESGAPMLSDFGVAKILEVEETMDLTGTGIGIGTPEYMAPEQGRGKTDQRSEVYALGIVLYELITGRKPYSADTPMAVLIMQATDPLPQPRKFAAGLPAKAEGVILKALAKSPQARYQNMREFAEALQNLAIGTRTEPVRSRRRAYLLLVGLLVIIVFMTGAALIGKGLLPASLSNTNTPSPVPTVSELVVVNANTRWHDSGIAVGIGDLVRISYVSGQWRGTSSGGFTNGMDCSDSFPSGLMPSASGTSLVAKIGEHTPFCVGDTPEHVSQYTGKLYLSYNDCDNSGCFSDNSGNLSVRVMVIPAQNLTATPPSDPLSTDLVYPAATPGVLLFSEDFEGGLARGFEFWVGDWQVVDDGTGNQVLQVMSSEWTNAQWGPTSISDGAIEFRIKLVGQGSAGLFFRASPSSWTGYGAHYSFAGQSHALRMYIQENDGGWQALEAVSGGGSFSSSGNSWAKIRLVLQGETMKVTVNDEPLMSAVDSRLRAGSLVLVSSPGTAALFDDFMVWDSESE